MKKYPFFTCEMGVGVQNTYHRRLSIDPLDGLGMMIAKLGSGSNLAGILYFPVPLSLRVNYGLLRKSN